VRCEWLARVDPMSKVNVQTRVVKIDANSDILPCHCSPWRTLLQCIVGRRIQPMVTDRSPYATAAVLIALFPTDRKVD